MRSLSFKKYQTCELKSKIIDYRGYSVKICAFYRASATALFFPNFKEKYGPIEYWFVFKEDWCLVNTKQPLAFYLV